MCMKTVKYLLYKISFFTHVLKLYISNYRFKFITEEKLENLILK